MKCYLNVTEQICINYIRGATASLGKLPFPRIIWNSWQMENCTLESPQTSWAATRPSSAASAAVASSELNSTTLPGCWVSKINCLVNYPENSEQTHLAAMGSVDEGVFKRNNKRSSANSCRLILNVNECFRMNIFPLTCCFINSPSELG